MTGRTVLARPLPTAGRKARDGGIEDGGRKGVTIRTGLVGETNGDAAGSRIGISRNSQSAGVHR